MDRNFAVIVRVQVLQCGFKFKLRVGLLLLLVYNCFYLILCEVIVNTFAVSFFVLFEFTFRWVESEPA